MALELDADGDQQLDNARRLMRALTEHDELDLVGRFNANRTAQPPLPLSSLGLVRGGSMGLPNLLAMLQARFGLRLARGTAATGVIHLSRVPSSPAASNWSQATRAGYLGAEVGYVRGVMDDVRFAVMRLHIPILLTPAHSIAAPRVVQPTRSRGRPTPLVPTISEDSRGV